MTERCKKHTKDSIARCIWCNVPLCSLCIAKKDGKKHYCKNCSDKLAEHEPHKNIRKQTLKKHSY